MNRAQTLKSILYLGISARTLVRWTDQGIVRCHRAGYWAHRHYAV